MRTIALLTVGLLMLGATEAQGILWTSNVTLTGLEENPPNASPGTGTAVVTFDDVTGQMNVNGSFSGLLANANNAHVHGYGPPGPPNQGVVFGLTFTASTSGTFSGSGIIPADRFDDVLDLEFTYINVHSSTFPLGEIRGQITNFVPEPASAVLLAGMGGLALMRRRRR